MVNGELHVNALGLGFFQQFEGQVQGFAFLRIRFANLLALRLEEGVGHGPANQEFVHLFHQLFQQQNLVADFGTTDNGAKRFGRIDQDLSKGFDFLLYKVSGSTLSQNGRNASHTRGISVSGSKGVGQVQVSIGGQGLGHDGAFFFLFGGLIFVKSKIFEHEDLTVHEAVNFTLSVEAIVGKQDGFGVGIILFQEFFQARGDEFETSIFGWFEGRSFIDDSLGSTQMAHENGFASV
mmetsp:Transcript_2193/g.4616  ORF Transcript_2193/g.4616 Transcript_2193/m.4616 type:complete len:236 (+) Transcript_2193:611-1318(+)